MKDRLANIVDLLSFVTFPKPTSEEVSETAPISTATLDTAAVSVRISCQFAKVDVPVTRRMNVLLTSVRIAMQGR